MSGAYLPVTSEVRDSVNATLAAFAARGFVPDVAQIVRNASAAAAAERNRQ